MDAPPLTRRGFLNRVGQGTLIAAVGPDLAAELGFAPRAFAEGGPEALRFGEIENLVAWMQETPVEKLQAGLVEKLRAGIPLKRFVAAGALANARTFGGEDYIGFHTFMALGPALRMAERLAGPRAALPVFKVLYRNTHRIGERGGLEAELLRAVPPLAELAPATAESLLAAVKAKKIDEAERLLAGLVAEDRNAAFDALLHVVQENAEVHRTVLPYRAWEMIDLVGEQHASALLRQSLRYCLEAETHRRPEWERHGKLLASLLEEHGLLGLRPGTKDAEDAFIDELSRTIFEAPPEDAAGAVALALAEGFRPEALGEAISLAANRIVLCDPGRIPAWEFPGKVVGSVHGDSVGVHASDAANAWRNLAGVSEGRNKHACLILGAWQVARDRGSRQGLLEAEAAPSKRQVDTISETDPDALMGRLGESVRGRLQSHAAAVVRRCEALGVPEQTVFSVLLEYAVSEDGALHAEKYFQTVSDDFRSTRPAFRWNHLVGLARVTASEYGYPAPGQEEARALLGV